MHKHILISDVGLQKLARDLSQGGQVCPSNSAIWGSTPTNATKSIWDLIITESVGARGTQARSEPFATKNKNQNVQNRP